MAQPTSSALRALALEYKSLQEEPVEGFRVKLVNEDNMFEWEVAIFGPPDTLYQGGYFKVPLPPFLFLLLLLVRACVRARTCMYTCARARARAIYTSRQADERCTMVVGLLARRNAHHCVSLWLGRRRCVVVLFVA